MTAGFNTSSVKSARGPLPKKMTLGFIGVAPEVTIVFDFCVVVYGVKLAFVVHLEEGGGVVFDVVNEEDAI